MLSAAKAVPDVPIILGHMGGETWWEGIRVAQEAPNIYLEICSTWTDPEKMRAGIQAVGAERILFGSDATFFDASHMLGAMEDAGLSPDEWKLIMRENTRNDYLGLDDSGRLQVAARIAKSACADCLSSRRRLAL